MDPTIESLIVSDTDDDEGTSTDSPGDGACAQCGDGERCPFCSADAPHHKMSCYQAKRIRPCPSCKTLACYFTHKLRRAADRIAKHRTTR